MKNFKFLAIFLTAALGNVAPAQTPTPTPTPAPAAATQPSAQVKDARLAGFADGISAVLDAKANHPDALNDAVNDLLALQHNQAAFLRFAAESQTVTQLSASEVALAKSVARSTLASLVENSRTDEQFSPPPGAAGSASAVARAGISSLLSAAIETGAITQSVSGNTATISGNADGVLRFLTDTNPFPFCDPDEQKNGCGTPVLRDIGVTASFDMQQGTTKTIGTSPTGNPAGTPPTLDILAGQNRFSGASLKYVFHNPQDTRSKAFQDAWSKYYNDNRDKFQSAGNTVLAVVGPALSPLIKDPGSIALQRQFRLEIENALNGVTGPAAAESVIETRLAQYLEMQLQQARRITPNFDAQVNSAVTAYAKFLSNIDELVKQITTKPVFSAEYNFLRPQGQPEISQFKVMSTLNPFGSSGTLSINLAGTLYNSASVSSQFGRWRDAQASMQLERKLAGDEANYPARLSLAGYFQYMISPGLISLDQGNFAPGTTIQLPQAAALALAPTGPIWVAEAQITFKLKNTGAEIPIAITRANRTDLIKATSTRGHIGITYDLDKLFMSQ
jgi:hypothetical protein